MLIGHRGYLRRLTVTGQCFKHGLDAIGPMPHQINRLEHLELRKGFATRVDGELL